MTTINAKYEYIYRRMLQNQWRLTAQKLRGANLGRGPDHPNFDGAKNYFHNFDRAKKQFDGDRIFRGFQKRLTFQKLVFFSRASPPNTRIFV